VLPSDTLHVLAGGATAGSARAGAQVASRELLPPNSALGHSDSSARKEVGLLRHFLLPEGLAARHDVVSDLGILDVYLACHWP
jgi:hypothetical protein